MNRNWTRRSLLGAAGVVAAGALAGRAPAQEGRKVKIIGVACSPRQGRSTLQAVQAALEAAREVSPNLEVELIDLGGMKIPGEVAAGVPLEPGERDDFPKIESKLRDPAVGGILIGTPTYFSSPSALCKAFLDRWMVYRRNWDLRDKVGGAIAVGAARNGGQELALQMIHAVMLGQDMVIVADGRPTSRLGGTAMSGAEGGVINDAPGMATVRGVGRRVAEVALKLAR
jgi:multimeric flavodoxin WrbA